MAPIVQTDDGPEFGGISLQQHALLFTRNHIKRGKSLHVGREGTRERRDRVLRIRKVIRETKLTNA